MLLVRRGHFILSSRLGELMLVVDELHGHGRRDSARVGGDLGGHAGVDVAAQDDHLAGRSSECLHQGQALGRISLPLVGIEALRVVMDQLELDERGQDAVRKSTVDPDGREHGAVADHLPACR